MDEQKKIGLLIMIIYFVSLATTNWIHLFSWSDRPGLTTQPEFLPKS
jgi:hypothetical protein